jgi:hypothetical protein
MKKAKIIYDSNKPVINSILVKRGYPATFDGMMDAFEDIGDSFLVEVFNEITSMYSEGDGNFWPKFKAIFHKATGIAGGIDQIVNREEQPSKTGTGDPSESVQQEKKKKMMLYFGLAALALIIIMVVVYALKK